MDEAGIEKCAAWLEEDDTAVAAWELYQAELVVKQGKEKRFTLNRVQGQVYELLSVDLPAIKQEKAILNLQPESKLPQPPQNFAL